MGDLLQPRDAAAPPDLRRAHEGVAPVSDSDTCSSGVGARPHDGTIIKCDTGSTAPKTRDMLKVLPLEMVHDCFRQLDWKDAIAVSQVSHAWRLAAISDRRLWTYYHIYPSCRTVDAAAHALATHLSRSDPLPFSFGCSRIGDALAQTVFDLVPPNLHRISELFLDHEWLMLRLMQLDAPLLKRLTSCRSHLRGVPAQFGRNAPRLEHLHTSVLALPSDSQPFAALRTLDIGLPYGGGLLKISFFHVFPNLTSLQLSNVTAKSLPMLTPLPRFVETVDLRMDRVFTATVDYSNFLRGVLAPCKIQEIHLYRAASFLDALVLFLTVWEGFWKLEIRGSYIRFDGVRLPPCEWRWYVGCNRALSLFAEGCCVEYLARLAELSVPISALLALDHIPARGAWDRRLPALRVLKLEIDDEDVDAAASRRMCLSAPYDGPEVTFMPALQSVELCVLSQPPRIGDWLTNDAPGLLQAHCGGRTLETVHIFTLCDIALSRPDVAPLLRVAKRVAVLKWGKIDRLFLQGSDDAAVRQ